MSTPDRNSVRIVFAQALEISPEQRARFLDRACLNDVALRAEVESLLAALDRSPQLFQSPTVSSGGIDSSASERPGSRIGAYKLLEEIGHGGFGTVFMAEQERPVRRRVALKVIRLGMDTRSVVARFESERQALAMMDHPHIAQVFDAGTTESGRPYFVMELVRGQPITTFADANRLDLSERLALFVQVCSAVQHAHSKGIIHRDIKPANVLVSMRDGTPFAKIIDFGIAKATEARLTDNTLFTEFHQLIGTPEYMSPEQAGGAPDIDTRSDVYSLGTLLYELLTGTPPIDSTTLRSAAFDEMRRIIREVDPPWPSTRLFKRHEAEAGSRKGLRPTPPAGLIAGDLDWIVMKAIDKDRARRYQTAIELADDVRRHIEGDPVRAAPPSRLYRVRKFTRRHRVLMVTVLSVAGALILGMFGTGIGLIAAMRAEQAALSSAERAASEADQAKAVNEFMREVLTSVEPQKDGAGVRLIDVMSSASASASKRFEAHPLLEAQIQDLLADVYSNAGNVHKASEAAQRVYTLYNTNTGADDPRRLKAEARMIGSWINTNRIADAESAIDSLLPRADRVLGPDSAVTLSVRRSQAALFAMRGRLDEAESLYLSLHAHPSLQDDHRTQTRILYSLCRVRQRRAPSHDPSERTEEWKRTVQLAGECVEQAEKASGAVSTDALRARSVLAQSLCDEGRMKEAADLCRSILSESEERFDDCHQNRRNARMVLADALAGMGEFDESATAYSLIIECSRKAEPPDTISLVSSIADGLKYFDRAERAAQGEALAREGLAALDRLGTGRSSHTLVFECYIAHFVSMSGRHDDAEPLFSKLLANDSSISGDQMKARLQRFYAAHLARQGRYEEAETRLNNARSLYGDISQGSRDRFPDEIFCGFIDLYAQWRRPEKVQEYERLRQDALGTPPRNKK